MVKTTENKNTLAPLVQALDLMYFAQHTVFIVLYFQTILNDSLTGKTWIQKINVL